MRKKPITPKIDGYVLRGSYNACMESGIIKKIPYMIGSTLNDIAVSPEQLSQGVRGSLYDGCIRFAQMLERQKKESSAGDSSESIIVTSCFIYYSIRKSTSFFTLFPSIDTVELVCIVRTTFS